ncbi:MAG: hypothetical protein M1312_02465, partial [Patescibacteria group bacterium]|nr:hypothetical protein [Patescibacteria group bacterium]
MPKTSKKIKLKVISSPEITDIFIALNVFGYDDENNPKGMSIIRKKLRSEISNKDFGKKYPVLKKMTRSYHPWHLINFA